MYWNQVLQEVLNKNNPGFPCFFTNLRRSDDELEHYSFLQFCKTSRPGEVRLYLGKGYPGVYFTRREAQCMVMLLDGKTMKEVGGDLSLSSRTVEYYVKNMKMKMDCRTKSELVAAVLLSDFPRQLKRIQKRE